jgi:5-(carboxyamino)imidazole ribonucleotide mutase
MRTRSVKKSAKNYVGKVAVIMGSKSDLPVMKGAVKKLKEFGIKSETFIVSAHRTPQFMQTFSLDASKNGFDVIIAGAGGAAHLPGMVASLTTLPVIGVPVGQGVLKGLDALFSIVQMPKGVPVATMAVNNSENAGIFAARILSLKYTSLIKVLLQFEKAQRTKVLKMNRSI